MCKHIYNPEIQYPKGTFFTYFIGWSELNKFYYGVRYGKYVRPSDLWSSYFTSSTPLKEFRKLNGEPDIIKVEFIFDTAEEAREYEEFILKKNDHAHNPNWLNLHNGGKGFTRSDTFVLSEEAKQKIRESLTGRTQSEETKKKKAETQKGRIYINDGSIQKYCL